MSTFPVAQNSRYTRVNDQPLVNWETVMNRLEKLFYTIDEACYVTGRGRTAIYQDIASGKLRASKCGRRTLIAAESLQNWKDSLLPMAAGSAKFKPVPSRPAANGGHAISEATPTRRAGRRLARLGLATAIADSH